MKPDITYRVVTLGSNRIVGYMISINNGWYTNATVITREQRYAIKQNKVLRTAMKAQLRSKFWRYIGAA